MKVNSIIKQGAVLVILMCLTMHLNAQDETVTIKESVEDSADFMFQRKYKYLDYNLIEERSLFKIGAKYILITNNKDSYFYNWIPAVSVGYERKTGDCFSILTQVKWFESFDTTLTFDLGVQGKYYFLKKNEILNNISADNFFGTYVLFGLTDIFSYQHIDKSVTKKQGNYFQISPNIQFGAGQQFAIAHRIYFDISMYGEYFFEDGFDFRIEGSLNLIIRGRKGEK